MHDTFVYAGAKIADVVTRMEKIGLDKTKIITNKQIQRIYVPRQDCFLRNKKSSENVKFIRGVTLTRYILSTYVDSNNA